VGSHAFCLTKKIKAVKDKFKIWNKNSFGLLEKDIFHKKEELRLAQENPHTIQDVIKESQIRD
jgi:hypothetical protein